MEKEHKKILLDSLFTGEITKDEFKTIIEYGLPPKPAIFFLERDKYTDEMREKHEKLKTVYKKIGFEFLVIEFKNVSLEYNSDGTLKNPNIQS